MSAESQVRAGSTPFQGEASASGPSRERLDGPAALTFARFSTVNRLRKARHHAGGGSWSGADWGNALAGEVGEACNIVKKLRRQETSLRGACDPDSPVLIDRLADEIGDVLCYLDLLAAHYGIDLAAAVTAKFNRVSVREGFPERLP